MTVLEYFDAFESYLAQIEDYDESFYLAKFIFGLRPALLTQVFAQHPATLLEAKVLAETLELTHSMVKCIKLRRRRSKQPSIVAPRRGDLAGCFSQSRAGLQGEENEDLQNQIQRQISETYRFIPERLRIRSFRSTRG